MKHSLKILCAIVLVLFLGGTVAHADKKKKSSDDDPTNLDPTPKRKKDEPQVLPLPKEVPSAVEAETSRIFFQVSPLSSKGLLSQQTRDAMRWLLRSNRGASIVRIRAFVAGSGDTRRIQEIAGEVFGEKHLSLPALTVVQAGALPLEASQVVLESTNVDKKTLNPSGVAFFSGEPGKSLDDSLTKLAGALHTAGLEPADVMRATCFVSSLEDNLASPRKLESAFPGAALDLIQMQRGPVTPTAECEAVARLRSTPAKDVVFLDAEGFQIALVNSPKLVFSSMQLAFGQRPEDVKLAFDRLQKALGTMNASLGNVAMSHVYVTSASLSQEVRNVRKNYYSQNAPPATTLLPFEALPSMDATFGVDVIAVP